MADNKRSRIFIIPLFFSIVIMAAIFMFSLQNGVVSGSTSLNVTRVSARLIFYKFDSLPTELQNEIISELHFSVRKAAHFTLYALYGFNVFLTFSFFIKKLRFQMLAALCISVVYASFDEIHQHFIPGRTGSIFDVLIDTAGAVFGIIAGVMLLSVINYIKNKYIKEN
ncbi:MAG: VanZ family protein [Oscillospiraceae bacterium]|nr:VanZ family protein [Oscillospiraceae bacterium]